MSGNFMEKIYSMITTRAVYYTLFAVAALTFISIIELIITGQEFDYTVTNNLLRLLILGAAIFYNIYVLIPKYLANKKFGAYMGFLVLLVFIVSPIEAFFIYAKSRDFPEIQANVVGSLNWSFVPNFFVVGASTLAKISMDWYRNLREKQELQNETLQSELRFLKSQINPHFLFNTLNSLYALTLKKSDKAPDIVLKLSEMMRYMLYDCNEKLVPLSREVSYISNYLELEKLRQAKSMDVRFDVKGSISDQKIAPLMFIPFIENCFKHGMGHQVEKGFVYIDLEVIDNFLNLRIENNKPISLPKQTHARSGGIGLVNVRRRLDLLYSGNYTLNIEDSPDSYCVYLKLYLEPKLLEKLGVKP
jgi:hypothetical protein